MDWNTFLYSFYWMDFIHCIITLLFVFLEKHFPTQQLKTRLIYNIWWFFFLLFYVSLFLEVTRKWSWETVAVRSHYLLKNLLCLHCCLFLLKVPVPSTHITQMLAVASLLSSWLERILQLPDHVRPLLRYEIYILVWIGSAAFQQITWFTTLCLHLSYES